MMETYFVRDLLLHEVETESARNRSFFAIILGPSGEARTCFFSGYPNGPLWNSPARVNGVSCVSQD